MNMQSDQSGFTLPELITTLVVASILVFAGAVAIINLSNINARARDLAVANAVAENKIEELRSSGYLNLTDGSYDFTSELPPDLNEPLDADYIISTASTGLKHVQVDISYNDQGETKTLSYVSYIGELGVGQY